MEILFALAGSAFFGIAVYKFLSMRKANVSEENGLVITGLVGTMTTPNGPVTITRILGPHSDAEPIMENRRQEMDSTVPWKVRREGDDDREAPFFDWQWRERTEDNPGDAYYNSNVAPALLRKRGGLATVKTFLSPARWWQFKKLSANSPNGEGPSEVVERR